MKHPNIRIARLKEMIALEEKHALLLSQIDVVNERLSTIQNELYGSGADRHVDAQTVLVKLKPKGMRKGRGELKGQILEMLKAAGKAGTSVRELADRIGIKSVNIHSWFSANLKKITGLKKVGEARYALEGVVASQPVKKAKAKKAKTAKAPKKVKAAKAVKASKVIKPAKAARKAKLVKPVVAS